MITDEEGDHVISADDQFLFAHDFARLHVATNIATPESLQFLFPEATSLGNGIALWDNIDSLQSSSEQLTKTRWTQRTSCEDGALIQVSISNMPHAARKKSK